ncbi:PorT family protein [Winogradskyella psychrotolerans]|uniref:PorT family protein n=1 Tax=Winogradskyella psychrotolerans TaxID=1344585 RepID=UPI001C067D9F|nr:PorT family protein [Winogradskyella psychrotolerans]MBU2930176.1 PorT family protein [Winogradskyella psychrotolerans]
MSKFVLFLFLLSSTAIFSQINFQEGYFIDKDNHKVSCLIENKDLERSPTYIDYKLSENSEIITIPISELKEFRIIGTDQFYVKYNVDEQLVGDMFGEMDIIDNIAFLRVLVDGDDDLLEYYNHRGNYFYFYEKNNILVYLEYKKYIDENNIIRENELFKKQLFDGFKCTKFTLEVYSKISYNAKDLSNFFSDYNECIGEDYLNVYDQRTKAKFNFKLKGGLNLITHPTNDTNYLSSYSIQEGSTEVNRSIGRIEDYDTAFNLNFGVELELRLTYQNNNWSIFVSPNYQNVSEIKGVKSYFEPNQPAGSGPVKITSDLSYSFIQIPIGLRRYFYGNNEYGIYVHLAYSLNITLNSEESIQTNIVNDSNIFYDLKPDTQNRGSKNNHGFHFGIGLNYLNKYAMEINYYSVGVNLDSGNNAGLKGVALNASYTLF